jgi:hypothetical protein
MKNISRSGVNPAIRIFLSHYCCFTWLREFALACKFALLLKTNDLWDEDKIMEEHSQYSAFLQMINDLFFLARFSVELFPTARNIWLIMHILDDLNDGRIRSYHNDDFFPQDIYFYASICSKMRSSHKRLSNLWLNVAIIPLKKQTNFDIYALAKIEEATAVDYPTSAWKDLLNNENHENDSLKQSIREYLIGKSLQQEWKQYYEVEAEKTRKDFIQHLLSKSTLNGDWKLVLSLQLQDVNHKTQSSKLSVENNWRQRNKNENQQ